MPGIDLVTLAKKLLKEQPTVKAAADALAARLVKDDDLRLAIALDFLTRHTPPAKRRRETHSRTKLGSHRKDRRLGEPTAAQKIGAIRAEKKLIISVFDRRLRGGKRLGDIRVHELQAIADASAYTAISFMSRGYADAVEVFVAIGFSKYCVSSDPFAKVEDIIKPTIATKIYEQAQLNAAKAMEEKSGKLVKELIAAAQQAELAP